MQPADVVLRFVGAINAHDVGAIEVLLTEDHRFVDSLGAVVVGAANLLEGWRAYLSLVPDYTIEVREACSRGELGVLFGAARVYCPEFIGHKSERIHAALS